MAIQKPASLFPTSPNIATTSSSSEGPSSSTIPVTLFDGGLGTTLESPLYSYNLKFNSSSTPLWSSHLLTTPGGREILLDVHRRFLRAGAGVIGAATYQGSFEGFRKTRRSQAKDGEREYFSDEEAGRLMREGMKIARQAIELERHLHGDDATGGGNAESDGASRRFCALSLGPLAATLIPSTEYTGIYPQEFCGVEALTRWHAHRLEVFFVTEGIHERDGGVSVESQIDIIAFETIGRVDEILGVRNAVKQIQRSHKVNLPPFWISCVFPGDMGEQGEICDGSDVEKVVDAMMSSSSPAFSADSKLLSLPLPSGIGINCTKLHLLPALISNFETAILSHLNSSSPSADVEAEAEAEHEHRHQHHADGSDKGLFHLILYPDGAPDLVYDTVTQTWVPKKSETIGSSLSSATAIPTPTALTPPLDPSASTTITTTITKGENGRQEQGEAEAEAEAAPYSQSWAQKFHQVIQEVVGREVERRRESRPTEVLLSKSTAWSGSRIRPIWRGIVAGGCCLVGFEGIEELGGYLHRQGAGDR